jgi:sugar/nucleoside kinase (ribokinase family)
VVVGNVALDRTPDGGWAPGGPSLYSARMALALGARVRLVTHLTDDYPRQVLEGIDVIALPADDVPRYVNTYDALGNRSQLLLTEGQSIPAKALDARGADVLLIAPAYHEVEAPPRWLPPVSATCFQGLLRERAGDVVTQREDAWKAVRKFARAGMLTFLSEEDTADSRGLALQAAEAGATAFVTHGSRGATRFERGAITHRAAFPAETLDPTGAGDAFATALALHLAEYGDPDAAFDYAALAGALAVEGIGLDGIPSRRQLEARLARRAA